MAALTGVSGIIGAVAQQHGESNISRRVFGNIPSAVQAGFYTVLCLLFLAGAFATANRMKNWERGQADDRRTTKANAKKRMGDFRSGVYMQTLMRDPAAGIMHSMIYFGFLALFAVTTVLEIDHQMPNSLKFLHGGVYKGYSAFGDTAGLIFTGGIIWAMVRRYIQRPYRIRIKNRPEDAVILITFLAIGVSGFLAEAARIALANRPDFEKFSYVGYALSNMFNGSANIDTWHQAAWGLHVASFFVFLVILPITKLRHMFTSPLNLYLKDRPRPKGAMRPMPNLMETNLESFGASTIEDFTWKQLLDTDACTMCGRCTAVCPAHATGKPLDPREIVLKVGTVMSLTGPGGSGPGKVSPAGFRRSRDHGQDVERVRAHHLRRNLVLHHVQGVRRELPRRYRNPRQDPRHAPLPLADGVRLPELARQRLQVDGKHRQPLGYRSGRARRLGQRHGRSRDRRPVQPA